jgi:hypothetical protein
MSELSNSLRQVLISCEVKAGDIGLVTQIFDDLLTVAEAAKAMGCQMQEEGDGSCRIELDAALKALEIR